MPRGRDAIGRGARRRLLALGDSYTLGEGVSPTERWPAQLARALRAEGMDVGEPVIVARTGWTTDDLSAAIEAATLDPPYALVTLLIGVNDQYRGYALAGYLAGFTGLLRRAVGLAGSRAARVVVVSIPDWGVTPLACEEGRDPARIATEVDAFNAAARASAAARRCGWVDVTGISRSADARAELVADGLHPAAAQYTRWTAAILPAARRALTHG